MPQGVEDRNADIWEPLLAVADIAGGDWPSLARQAAMALVAAAREIEPSLNIRLLADLRTIFGDEEQQLTTKTILEDLCAIEDAPWSDLKGKPITDNQLGRRLRQYGVKSKVIRIGNSTPRGYRREDLRDVWRRYLPSLSEKPATGETSQSFQWVRVAAQEIEAATEVFGPQHGGEGDAAPVAGGVAACCSSSEARIPDGMGVVAAVAPFAATGEEHAPIAKVSQMGRSGGPLPMATRRSGYTPRACASLPKPGRADGPA